MKWLIALLLNVFFLLNSWSQDEHLYRQIMAGVKEEPVKLEKQYKYLVRGPSYKIDLDRDGLSEKVVIYKGDGDNIFEIHDYSDNMIFQERLPTIGRDSSLYKINTYQLSKGSKVLVLHFYEGYSKYIGFNGSARLYFLTLDNRDLRTLSLFKGPSYFFEREQPFAEYGRRNYTLKAIDYNGDGVREISIKHRKISRVFSYYGKGRWMRI